MGLMNRGGWEYYGGPSGAASGVNAFVDNFLKTKLGLEANTRQNQEAEIMNQIRQQQLTQMQAEQTREKGFQNAIQSGMIQPVSEQDALFAAAKNNDSTAYQTMPSGKQAAVMTPEGEQQIQGLMQGGFDSAKAMAAAMPYTKAEQFPQMLTEMKAIEMMPVEQRIKILDMLKTQSEINKNNETWSAPYVGEVGGKKVLLRKNSHGKVEQVSQDTSTTVHNYPQKDFKPTEGDLRYLSYTNQMKKQGKTPIERYQFDQWYFSQTEGVKQENKKESIEAAKKPWEKDAKKSSSPTKLTYNPATGQFE